MLAGSELNGRLLLLLLLLLLQVLEVVLQQRVERGGQHVSVQDFIGSSIGALAGDCTT
jgi:hypothetical protein